MQDAVIFRPDGLFVRHNGEVEELKAGRFFENALLPVELDGVPLVWDLFRAIEHMKKHEVKTLGQMARMNIFEFLSEMEQEPKDVPTELHAVCVRRREQDNECIALGKDHEAGNGYSVEFYPVNVIRELPIIIEHGDRPFTALEFITTALWFIGWYSTPDERDKEHAALLAKAKDREPIEEEVTIQ